VPSTFPPEMRAQCEALARLLPPGGWCLAKPSARETAEARREMYGAMMDAIHRLYGTGAGASAGIVRMDLALRNSVGEGTPVYGRWI